MPVRPILEVPDPRLRDVSAPVGEVTDETRALMDDMLATMYAAPGIGLAAIQIGVAQRVVVMDLAGEDEPPAPRYFVDPVISEPSGETAPYDEGCLSIPGIYEEVERPAACTVDYLDYDGTHRRERAEGLFAVCIQHEVDHLNGVLFLDHLSRLKRERIMRKIKKEKLAAAG